MEINRAKQTVLFADVLKTESIISHNLIYFRHYGISFWPLAPDIVLINFTDLSKSR